MWGKIRQDFRKFLPKQSMQNILYVIILTLTLLVAVFVGFFVSKSQQEKQAQIIVQDNQELAEQINVSMSQYLHSMMRLSDTLYYNIIKGNDRGQMEQMFQAMYDGYKDYVESIALFQEDGTLLQVMPALSSAASSDPHAYRYFFLYFPGNVLCDRCLPGNYQGPEKLCKSTSLHILFPTADRRTYCEVS